ncbi:MAG TPA: B12-binding domain-containing protein, partial [Thermoanaerobaculia bacterium]
MERPIVQPRAGELWTSAEAAQAFRVGVSSIKRWTDEGELESVRTVGGHRRYTLEALHRFAAIRNLPTHLLPPLDGLRLAHAEIPPPADVTLYDALARGDAAAIRRLVNPRVQSLAQRAVFLDRVVGDAMREIGFRWERGELGVDEEHRASHMLINAIDNLRPDVGDATRCALLVCPPDEWHDIPLRLVRLMMEWCGWKTEFAGANLPWDSTLAAVKRCRPQLVAFSARRADLFQARDFDRFVSACLPHNAKVIVGGEWARGGTGEETPYLRFRSLRGF